MKIAINQPNYIPWIGYFDLIDQVDKFIFLDDAQFSKGSFISRNKISNLSGKSRWLSLSLNSSFLGDVINKKMIVEGCLDSHLEIFSNYYRKAPYFKVVYEFLEYEFKKQSSFNLGKLNTDIIISICKLIGIKCDFFNSSDSNKCSSFKSSEKVFCLIDQYQCKSYYNFSKGIEVGLHTKSSFSKRGKLLFRQDYKHPTYLRPYFQPYMSIVDLLFYELTDSLDIIRSGSNWTLMNPETI